MFIKYIVFLTTHALIMDGEILLMSNTFVLILLQCFLLYIHLAKSANQNLELSPPPNPPPAKPPGSNSKRYSSLSVIKISNFHPPPTPPQQNLRGATQSDIHRFPSSAWPPPTPPPSLSVILPSATALSVINGKPHSQGHPF